MSLSRLIPSALFEGGAWIAGDLGLDDSDLRIISISEKISIASVDNRLAPEYPFPTQIDDSYAGFKWVNKPSSSPYYLHLYKTFLKAIANAEVLKVDLSKGVIVAGSSAGNASFDIVSKSPGLKSVSVGGNLAAQVTLHARDDPDPAYFKAISGQILQMPFLAMPAGYPER